jgi:hypothetical protein
MIGEGTQAEGVFEHGPKNIFVAGRDEVTGEWRRLHNEELWLCTAQQILFR